MNDETAIKRKLDFCEKDIDELNEKSQPLRQEKIAL